jgi:PIN domain nuclease of toxin-antitoxin system
MKAVVADTHAILWFLENDKRLTIIAGDVMDMAQQIFLPSICLVEITYLVEKRRLDSAVVTRLLGELDLPTTTLQLASLDLGVTRALQRISRADVPDMPDRIIAATAWHYCVPLVTCDRKIRSCGIDTIW